MNSRNLYNILKPPHKFSVETRKFTGVERFQISEQHNDYCAPFRKYAFYFLICMRIKRTLIFSFGRKCILSFGGKISYFSEQGDF